MQCGSPVASPGQEWLVSPLAEFDRKLERIIHELTLRILVPDWTKFDAVWEAAIRVCDRYEIGKNCASVKSVSPH